MLYWTELGGNGHGKIRKASLNGSNPLTLLGDEPADSVFYPSGITLRASSATTGVPEVSVPLMFFLDQNYPNPFNPKTVISGQWTVDSEVRLVVYDMLGREVATLANGRYPAGKYSFSFDGRNLASGVYFYHLTAGSFSAVRRMLLVR